MTRSFNVRPRSGKVKLRVVTRCTKVEFCESAMRIGEQPHIRRFAARNGLDPDDAMMDFVLAMLRTRRWRDHDTALGSVDRFVAWWFVKWVTWYWGRHRRCNTERQRRSAMSEHQAAISLPPSIDDERERVDRALGFAPEENRAALIARVRLGTRLAAIAHGTTATNLYLNSKRGVACARKHLTR